LLWHYFSGIYYKKFNMAYAEGYYQPLLLSIHDLLGRFRNSKEARELLHRIALQRISLSDGVNELEKINSDLKRSSGSSASAASQPYPATKGTIHHFFAELSTTAYLLSGSVELVEILDYTSKGGDADKTEEALLMWARLSDENKDTAASLVPLRNIGGRA
jgi:hypothetical protein